MLTISFRVHNEVKNGPCGVCSGRPFQEHNILGSNPWLNVKGFNVIYTLICIAIVLMEETNVQDRKKVFLSC
jgi:hypothetical protein